MSELKNEFGWSFSRHGTLEDCPRRFFYRHHGSWGGWDTRAGERPRELYRLGKLEHRPMWAGKTIHTAIARALWDARDGRPVQSEEDVNGVLADVLHQMRQEYKDSVADTARKTGKYKWHARFFEHESGADDGSPAWRARWKETADQVEKGLRNFFKSRIHGTLKDLPAADWIELEDSSASFGASFEVDGVKVFAKIDCAFREGGQPVLVDWKTGRRLSQATSVQLAIYALYLQHRHGIDPSELRAREINVVTGESAEHDVGPHALEDFKEVFSESVREMRSYLSDVENNTAKPEEEWPFARDLKDCRYCSYRSACEGAQREG